MGFVCACQDFAYIPNMTHRDGMRFLDEYEKRENQAQKRPMAEKSCKLMI